MWTDDEWDSFAAMLGEGWHGDFDQAASRVWRVLLTDVEPKAAVGSLKRLLLQGRAHRPSLSELLAEVNHDPSAPTYDEAMALIFGPRGLLNARPLPGRYRDADTLNEAYAEAKQQALADAHPLVASFVVRQGWDRLNNLGLLDPVYGEVRRRELRQAWDDHTRTSTAREIAALAAGRSKSDLRQLDPLAALNVARQLTPGETPK